VLAIAIIAALLPTLDPVTLMLEMVPLLLLYELSIQVARLFAPRIDYVERGRDTAEARSWS
jgi:sec-independent protein translocase protein TatC